MTKMTQEELLEAFEVLADMDVTSAAFRASERIRQHLVAVEAEVAQARERALDGVCALADLEAAMLSACGDGGGANAVRVFADKLVALKSEPAREPKCSCRDPECLLDCRIHGKPVEMASEENGLLPKRRRREHEYGEEYKADFGSFIAECARSGCQAFRVSSRGKHHVHFKQYSDAEPTDKPGPCKVEP